MTIVIFQIPAGPQARWPEEATVPEYLPFFIDGVEDQVKVPVLASEVVPSAIRLTLDLPLVAAREPSPA
jgi:hypothetical protein